jgi:hypothetical protein
MKFRGGEFSTGTTGNFQPELTIHRCSHSTTSKPPNLGTFRE